MDAEGETGGYFWSLPVKYVANLRSRVVVLHENHSKSYYNRCLGSSISFCVLQAIWDEAGQSALFFVFVSNNLHLKLVLGDAGTDPKKGS